MHGIRVETPEGGGAGALPEVEKILTPCIIEPPDGEWVLKKESPEAVFRLAE